MKYITIFLLIVFSLPLTGWCDRSKEWVEDFDFFYRGIKTNHINPFSKISEQEFLNQISFLKKNVQSNTDFQIMLELMKLTRQIGDGHTAVHFQYGKALKQFPIEVYDDSGTWRVVGITDEFKTILGAEVTHITATNPAVHKIFRVIV